jgi:hypothetical protein
MSTPGSTVSSGSMSGRQLVRLNVGGKSFVTSKSTLEKDAGSMLSVLLSGEFAESSEDGEIFIDRDGSRFVHVLNYLRDGKLNVDYNRAKRESTHPFLPLHMSFPLLRIIAAKRQLCFFPFRIF